MFTSYSHTTDNNNTSSPTYITTTDQLMKRKLAARYIKTTAGTMAVWDCTKRHDLKPVKRGNRVYYYKSVLDRFLQEQMTP